MSLPLSAAFEELEAAMGADGGGKSKERELRYYHEGLTG